MHLQLNDSSATWHPGDVILGSRESAITTALTALVGAERADLLLRRAGPNGLEHMDADELGAVTGVPHDCAERIVAARTFAGSVRERTLPRASRPERLLAALPPNFGCLEREVLLGIALTGANHVKAVVVLSVGGIAGAAVLPRDVFMPMFRHGASAFALAHNHPSGDDVPSQEDVIMTNALTRAGVSLGLPLVDHLVVARSSFTSMRDVGLLLRHDEVTDLG